jgi:H+/Cl- antiporter ClcA
LVGAPAGREGTAIQIGAAIADRFHFLGEKFQQNRSLFLLAGIGAGFAALFGTPWAGALFAVEILRSKTIPWSGIFPALTTSFVAYFTCLLTGAPHTHYSAVSSIPFETTTVIYIFAISALFGLVALVYVYAHQFFKSIGAVLVRSNIWRPFYGGIVLFIIFAIIGNTRFMGLGIPSILDSFENHATYYDFMIKLLLTAFTLAFGFKGGEVTPLFFIGATLGSALSMVVPIPIALMAAMGFLAVFAGATKTFLACSVMGVELFGWEAFPYFIASCLVAQIFSGRKGIYNFQAENKISFF